MVGYYTDRRPQPQSLAIGMTFTLAGCCCLPGPGISARCSRRRRSSASGSSIFHPESSRIARLASGGQHGLAQSLFQVGGNAGSAVGPLLAAFIVLPRGQAQPGLVRAAPRDGDRAAVARRPLVQAGAAPRDAARRSGVRAAPHCSAAQVTRALAVLLVLVFSKYIYLASLEHLLHVLPDRDVSRVGAERAAAPVRVPRRGRGRHDPRRPGRRSHSAAST